MSEPSGPTMASIGRVAGVSRQTVWNVLHAPDKVRPETRARVERAIRDERYRPNRVARSLRTRSARLLGYCMEPRGGPDLNPVQDRFLHAVTEAAEARGYHVLLFTTQRGDPGRRASSRGGREDDRLDGYAELLAEAAVDGFVLSDTTVDDPRQAWLHERGVPYAAFGRSWSDGEDPGPWVDIDGAAGVESAVTHLYEQGHRRIGFVGWPTGSGVGEDRVSGWRRGCERLGLAPGPLARGDNTSDTGQALAAELLDGPDAPTALVCVSDVLALGCLAELRRRGLRPGADIGVTGFDDAPFAALPGVELSSVEQPIERVGADVVRLLIDQLTGEPPAESHIVLAPSLRVRASSIHPTTDPVTP
ncbi:LacI family DNA-binding transcriptional regulator [Actinocatenispora rupis]|uniref:Alanine racemase n=1 Tax=Actinocatenispora rupis TaxID=519421 RepID=A0A8J3IVH4_9ACTN|nr:LacI family DNA-binding transcriptional regulator [Actinocatenispora rupis]GID10706.1 alanine racemase [Actinocatenispora rupis]